jgi:rubrerythrin
MGWYPGKIVERIMGKGLLKQKAGLTPSLIDSTIRDIQRYIEDEKRVEQLYYTESQNPVIKAINASDLFLELASEERTHAQELEALIPKLKEKWVEIQGGLV